MVAGAYIQTRPGGTCQMTNSIAVAPAADAVMTIATHPPMLAGFWGQLPEIHTASDTIETSKHALHLSKTCD